MRSVAGGMGENRSWFYLNPRVGSEPCRYCGTKPPDHCMGTGLTRCWDTSPAHTGMCWQGFVAPGLVPGHLSWSQHSDAEAPFGFNPSSVMAMA